MRRLLRFWSIVGIGWVAAWVALGSYERLFSNGDGFLAGININVLFQYISWFLLLILFLFIGIKSKHNLAINLSLSISSLVFFLLVGELLCFFLLKFNMVNAPKPLHTRLCMFEGWSSPERAYWGDYNNDFGSWRLPNDKKEILFCHGDTVKMKTNSFGMRDSERSLMNENPKKKRVVMMGDSFLEGYMVNDTSRCSNLLEKQTGVEHLNFGIKGTSVISYYLKYKHLAKRFEHDVVMVSLLIANDFEDFDATKKTGLLKYPIYRPYWDFSTSSPSLKYSLANISQSLLANDNYKNPIRTYYTVDSLYHSLSFKEKIGAEIDLNSYLFNCIMGLATQFAVPKTPTNSFAKEAYSKRWGVFAHSLEQLALEAKGKKVIVYTVPIANDLRAYQKAKKDDVSPQIEAICRKYNITYINTLPYFYKAGEETWDKLYEPCDGHWTPEGEKFLATILLNNLAYCKAVGI